MQERGRKSWARPRVEIYLLQLTTQAQQLTLGKKKIHARKRPISIEERSFDYGTFGKQFDTVCLRLERNYFKNLLSMTKKSKTIFKKFGKKL